MMMMMMTVIVVILIAMLSRVAIKLIPIDHFTTSRYVVCPGAVESRIEKRREEMAAGTFKDEPQDMLDMMLPSLQWGRYYLLLAELIEIQEEAVFAVNLEWT